MFGVVDTGYDLPSGTRSYDFYNGKDPYWSFLNYVNTNMRSFAVIMKHYNEMNDEKIYNVDTADKVTKVNNFINEYAEEIFKPSDGVFRDCLWDILGKISTTRFYGDYAEEIAARLLTEKYNMENVDKSVPGDKRDAFYGVDITFDFKGKNQTAQCKIYNNTGLKLENGGYLFSGPAITNYKNIDYFIFVNMNMRHFYIFRTISKATGDRIEINENGYFFKESLKVDDGRYEY